MKSGTSVAGASAALLLVTFAAAAGAHGPPAPPTIPDLPDLGKPDDKAKFRVIVEGDQSNIVDVTGNIVYGNCTFEADLHDTESWEFARGKGVTMIFERFRRIVLMRRQGHPPGDTTLALVGTVTRKSTGGYNEYGPGPGCRGLFPATQTNCNTTFPVNSPLSLYFSPQHVLSLDRTASSASSITNPAFPCGEDSDDSGESYYYYSFPTFLNTELGELSKQEIFGKRKAFTLENGNLDYPVVPGPITTRSTIGTSVIVRFVRLGKD